MGLAGECLVVMEDVAAAIRCQVLEMSSRF
jgi:hypothetical protein